jgi:hypothetical protein
LAGRCRPFGWAALRFAAYVFAPPTVEIGRAPIRMNARPPE